MSAEFDQFNLIDIDESLYNSESSPLVANIENLNSQIKELNLRLMAYSPHIEKLSTSHKVRRYKARLQKAIAAFNDKKNTDIRPISNSLNKLEVYLARIARTDLPPIQKNNIGFFSSPQRAVKTTATVLNPKTTSFISRATATLVRAARTISDGSNYGRKLLSLASSLSSFSSFAEKTTRIINAIPLFNLIIGGFTPLYNAAKAFLKNKKPIKIGLTVFFAGITILGSISIMGIGVATLAAGLITLSIATVGLIVNNLLPIKNTWQKINALKKELKELSDGSTFGTSTTLTDKEKLIVMTALNSKQLTQLLDSKILINNQNVTLTDIAKTLGLGQKEMPNWQTVIENRKKNITNEISRNTTMRRDQFIRTSNTLLTLTGIILTCIPSPPTIAVGLSILAASAIIGIIIDLTLSRTTANLAHTLAHKIKPQALSSEAKNLLATTPTPNPTLTETKTGTPPTPTSTPDDTDTSPRPGNSPRNGS